MGNGKSIESYLVLGITALFLILSFVQMIIGYDTTIEDSELDKNSYESFVFDRSVGQQTFECSSYEKQILCNHPEDIFESKKTTISEKIYSITSGPMDSPWPMKCHDTHHTGRSPYGTANNSYYELWRYEFDDSIEVDPAIGEDGIIYVGGTYQKLNQYLYSFNPNGTLRWRYRAGDLIWHMCPAIAEDGTIYFGSWDGYLHAVNPNGTRKWGFNTNDDIVSDPVIDEDGTVYFGTLWGIGAGGEIFAVNPNGTEKWRYKTGDYVSSDPAISDDGTIYIGSGDNYLYAMNPNGTVKWKFKTRDDICGPPSIADDGTVYFGSFDGDRHLYALYPNGTLRWKTEIWYGSDINPSIGLDGTIYISSASKLYAINPENGSIKWVFNLGGIVRKSSPAICADGIIYTGIEIGNMEGGEIVAVNPDGTEWWRRRLSDCWVDSSPCIGENGVIYIVSSNHGSSTLHAFGIGGKVESDSNGPYYGMTNKSVNFSGNAIYGYPPYYWQWDFGDGEISNEQNPSHIYESPGKYTVTLNVTDNSGNCSENSTLAWIQEFNNPPDKPTITGETIGKIETEYEYTFLSSDPDGFHIWYYIDWGDDRNTGWLGPFMSGEPVTNSHSWWAKREFTIKCKTRDPYGVESEWGELEVTMPKTKHIDNWWLLQFLEKNPHMFPIIRQLLGLD